MLTKTNLKEVADRFIELWDTGDANLADDIFRPGFIDHDPAPGQGPGIEGHLQILAAYKSAFPDLRVKREDIVEDENQNKVALRWSGQGTHSGELMQIPATGKKVTLKGMDILKIENGKIAKRWAEFDAAGMLTQLGVIQA